MKLTIKIVCRGGCNEPERFLPRQSDDPPEAETLVFHSCNDGGEAFHYEDVDGKTIAGPRA